MQRARDGPGRTRFGSPAGCNGLVACHGRRSAARSVLGVGRRTAGAAAGFRLQRGRGSWSPDARCSARCTRTTRSLFGCAASGQTNDLELKLVDSSGQNVWRHVQRNLQPPARWKRFQHREPRDRVRLGSGERRGPQELGAIELAIVAREGGAGTLWVSDLRIEDHSPLTGARASASSALPGFDADRALAGSGWIPSPDDARPWIAVDFAETRRLGGLIIDWRDGAPASGFRVRASSRGRRWRTLYTTPRAGGARSYLYLPNLKTTSSSAGVQRTVSGRRLAPPVVRVQPFHRDLLVQHRSPRGAGLVPALAASRANPVGADRDRKRHALRSHQRGRRGRDDAGVASRSSRWWRSTAVSLPGQTSFCGRNCPRACYPCRLRSGKPQSGTCTSRARQRRAGSFVCAIDSRTARTDPCRRACWCSFARFR